MSQVVARLLRLAQSIYPNATVVFSSLKQSMSTGQAMLFKCHSRTRYAPVSVFCICNCVAWTVDMLEAFGAYRQGPPDCMLKSTVSRSQVSPKGQGTGAGTYAPSGPSGRGGGDRRDG